MYILKPPNKSFISKIDVTFYYYIFINIFQIYNETFCYAGGLIVCNFLHSPVISPNQTFILAKKKYIKYVLQVLNSGLIFA